MARNVGIKSSKLGLWFKFEAIKSVTDWLLCLGAQQSLHKADLCYNCRVVYFYISLPLDLRHVLNAEAKQTCLNSVTCCMYSMTWNNLLKKATEIFTFAVPFCMSPSWYDLFFSPYRCCRLFTAGLTDSAVQSYDHFNFVCMLWIFLLLIIIGVAMRGWGRSPYSGRDWSWYLYKTVEKFGMG